MWRNCRFDSVICKAMQNCFACFHQSSTNLIAVCGLSSGFFWSSHSFYGLPKVLSDNFKGGCLSKLWHLHQCKIGGGQKTVGCMTSAKWLPEARTWNTGKIAFNPNLVPSDGDFDIWLDLYHESPDLDTNLDPNILIVVKFRILLVQNYQVPSTTESK